MAGFGLLLGHLVGDYIFQNDWMARWKSGAPAESYGTAGQKSFTASVACTVHCLLYTAAVGLFSFWWMPWWGYVVCFAVHWPIDRWRLARVFMRHTQHEAFASGPLSPWSIILTDNILHLLTLWVIAVCSVGV